MSEPSLTEKKCVPCEGGIPPMSQAEAAKVRERLHQDWQLLDDAKALRREFEFKDFYRAMSFANAIAHVANIEDHHPDLEVGWGYVRVVYSTHAVKGLTENDFICAAKIDRIPPI